MHFVVTDFLLYCGATAARSLPIFSSFETNTCRVCDARPVPGGGPVHAGNCIRFHERGTRITAETYAGHEMAGHAGLTSLPRTVPACCLHYKEVRIGRTFAGSGTGLQCCPVVPWNRHRIARSGLRIHGGGGQPAVKFDKVRPAMSSAPDGQASPETDRAPGFMCARSPGRAGHPDDWMITAGQGMRTDGPCTFSDPEFLSS